MLVALRLALATLIAFLLNNWWRILLVIVVAVLIWNFTTPILQAVAAIPQAFSAKLTEWQTVIAAPWPTPVPPVRSLPPAPFVNGNAAGSISSVCEFDYKGTRVSAPNSKDLQWFTLNNANRILFVCNGRVQHVFAEIPPEHFNDWMLYLPPELQNMTVPDMAVPATPQSTPAPTPAPQGIAPQPAPASLDCPVFGGVKTTPIGDGGCLYKGTVVTDNVPTNWWAWWGIPAHRQDSGIITANQVSFYPN